MTIKDTGKVQTVNVKDAPILEVPDTPQTGGNMLILSIAAGLLMVVGATVMIWKKRALVTLVKKYDFCRSMAVHLV